MQLDLNCDLGEGESPARTRALMRQIGSANIACGVHAGDLATMDRCLRMAAELGVRAGAHPGVAGGFGRGEVRLPPSELGLLVVQQVGGLAAMAAARGFKLHHIKLHGSLYHATEADPGLANAYLEAVQTWFPKLRVYALAGGSVVRLGRKRQVEVWEEGFIDRNYRADGSLVPRGEAGALVTDPASIRRRLEQLLESQEMEAVCGTAISLRPRTLCLHSDSPSSLRTAFDNSRASVIFVVSPSFGFAFQPADGGPGASDSKSQYRLIRVGRGPAEPTAIEGVCWSVLAISIGINTS